MHPTAARLQERLRERGLTISVLALDDSARTVPEAAAAVGCEPAQIVKSLVFLRDGEPVMVLCAGDRRVANKRLGPVARERRPGESRHRASRSEASRRSVTTASWTP